MKRQKRSLIGVVATERKKLNKRMHEPERSKACESTDHEEILNPDIKTTPEYATSVKLRGDQIAFFKIFGNRVSFVSSDIFSTRSCKLKDPDLALPRFLIQNLRKTRVKHLFPIQKELISKLGHVRNYVSAHPPDDMYICTHTGSGKTLSYAIPIVKLLSGRVTPLIRALILIPTWGLANQIYKVFTSLVTGSDLTVGIATSGINVNKNDLFMLVDTGISNSLRCSDILIATPGTLIKCISHSEPINLTHVEYLVVDEIDCLLDQDFGDWIRVIQDALAGRHPSKRSYTGADITRAMMYRDYQTQIKLSIEHAIPLQKLLFSATISYDPAKLASLNLNNPAFLGEKGPDSFDPLARPSKFVLPSTISENMVLCSKCTYKPLSLLRLIVDYNLNKTLVFVRSTEAAARLSKLIKIAYKLNIQQLISEKVSSTSNELMSESHNIICRAFSSKLPLKQRKKVLSAFENNKLKLLITTAIMARGIDVKDVKSVINYDIPTSAKTYLHRVGRTGRAGQRGLAFTVLSPSQVKWFKNEMKSIERDKSITKIIHSNFDAVITLYTQALAELELSVSSELGKKG